MIRRLLIALVRLYQRAISPLKLPTCRFHPSCSAYFIEAVEKHGAFKGSFMGIWRILRCNPLCKGGYDPVTGKEEEAESHQG
ncbi:MAG: membrane protein insertion efficiency factor YidD [Planctomycetota bacterium]|jgi:putative membrane protein insertion efficiency factor